MSNKQSKFSKLVPGRCRYCDRQFFYHPAGRPPLYCDQKCRQGEFRRSRYLASKNDESGPKTQVKSKTFGSTFADRPSSLIHLDDYPSNLIRFDDWPVNVVGGFKWYGAAERELWAALIEPNKPTEAAWPSTWKPRP
jgi:hypothetical protein